MHDIGDSKQVRTAERREKRKLQSAADHLRTVMQTASGRAVMRGIVGMGDLMSDGYVPGGPEAQRHQDYLAGRRSICVEVLARINADCPDLGELMLREGHDAEKREREEREADETDSANQEQDDG